MPTWLLSLFETVVPSVLQFLVNEFSSHPAAATPEIQAKIQAHQTALDALKK